MNRLAALFWLSLLSVSAISQSSGDKHTLLWKISGNGLENSSYLFGTIHMICQEDAELSSNFKKAIRNCDEVYFEVDLDNLFEIFGAMGKMKMKGDTTLRDLLTDSDYQKVKRYFEENGSMMPFSMLETFKPMLAASTLEEGSLPCENSTMMEQVILKEAKACDKKIKGLETMSYQAGILDSIPYKMQAEQLVAYIDHSDRNDNTDTDTEMKEMFKAYKEQDLNKLEMMMIQSDMGLSGFTDILLYHRNENWVNRLKTLMPGKSLVIAVGAGHLPGEKGLINLLRKQGYTVTPVENKVQKSKEI
jgi:uncharacterized protein YbaP (TraB family)